MLGVLKLATLLSLSLGVKSQFLPEEVLGSGVLDYSASYDYPTEEEEPTQTIKDYSKLVEKLYDKIGVSLSWMAPTNDDDFEIFCGFGMLWELKKLKSIVTNKADGILSEEEKYTLLSIAESDIQNELKKSQEDYPGQQCLMFYNQLQNNREGLDCAIGSEVVSGLFSRMTPYNSECWPFAGQLWTRIVTAGDLEKKGCSVSTVYDNLITVGKLETGSYKADLKSKEYAPTLKLMAKMTEIISRPERLKYLTRLTCGGNTPALSCRSVTSLAGETACRVIDVATVDAVESIIKSGRPSPRDMSVMLELMCDLTDILHELSQNKLLGQTRSSRVAVNNLEDYLDIMDHTIGESAHAIWTELPEDEMKDNLKLVLLNNDEYIGAMSKILFDAQRHKICDATLDKAAMAITLKEIDAKNQSELVGFEFNETQIETELPMDGTTNKFNVYAVHYKSWAELLQKEGLKVNNTGIVEKTKFFVGEGGIVSLSARTESGEKSSLPVTYKMKFKKVEVDEGATNGVRRGLCVSCEFFNTSTGDWEDTGCQVSGVTEEGVTCHCNHTTNFAAFMSPVPIQFEMTEEQKQAKQIVSYVGSTLSVLSLATSLIIFNVVRPTVKNDRLKAHMNLAFALFVVHMTQLFSDFVINIDAACLTVAVVTHFFLLASFFWMLIEGIFLYLYVVQVFVHSTIEYLRWLYVAGWLLPAIIVAISAGIGIPRDTYLDVYQDYCDEPEILYPPMTHDSKYEQCWLSAKTGMAWSFIAPALVIIVFNTIILCKVFQVLKKVSSRGSNIRPFRPTSSSKKETNSGYLNRSYGRKELDNQDQQKSPDSKVQRSKNLPESTGEYGSTSLSNGHSSHSPHDSPSRFDARVPSQAYMHNRAHPVKTSPEKSDSNGKHFLSDVRAALKGAMVLLPILGIPWVFGLLVANSYFALMLFLVMNSTQGFAIFVVYCLMNGEVKRAMQRRIKTAKLRNQTGRSRTSSTSSLRSLNSKFVRTWRSPSSDQSHK